MADAIVSTVPQDNVPMTSSVLPKVEHPAYAEGVPVARTNVLLRNGTTVAIDDYDEKVHGKKVEETDEAYRHRMSLQPSGRTPGLLHPRTTLPNLHTFDSTQVPVTPVAPVIPPTPAIPASVAGLPVLIADEENHRLLNPPASQVIPTAAAQQRAAEAKKAATAPAGTKQEEKK